MLKDDWTDFHAWVDRASIGGILAARDRAYELRRHLRDPDCRMDLRRMVRSMDHELLTRSDLARLKQRQARRIR